MKKWLITVIVLGIMIIYYQGERAGWVCLSEGAGYAVYIIDHNSNTARVFSDSGVHTTTTAKRAEKLIAVVNRIPIRDIAKKMNKDSISLILPNLTIEE